MRPAMDSAIRFSRAAITTVLGLLAASNSVGCARLEQFRQKNLPALGAVAAGRGKASDSTSKPTSTASRQIDAYTQAIKNKQALTEQEQLAARDESPKRKAHVEAPDGSDEDPELAVADTEGAGGARGRTRLAVSLQPPVPLDDAPVLASNTAAAAPGWQPGGTPDENEHEAATPRARRRSKPAGPETAESAEAIVRRARARLDQMANYQVHLNRQERVGAKLLPVEDVLLSVRRNPKAVRLEWPDGPHKGREVIYSASENGGLMQVNMADSPVPVPRLSLPPDSPLVMSNSRHPITEAGFDTILQNLETAIRLEKAGTPTAGTVEYAGRDQPSGIDHPCDKLVRVTPSGETWVVYIDPKTNLPTFVQATASDGSLLERYLFLDPKADLAQLAQSDAFDVARRWGPAKGLLSRLVRPNGTRSAPADGEALIR